MDDGTLHREFVGGRAEAVSTVRVAIEHAVARFRLDGGPVPDLVQESLGRVYLALILGRFRGEATLTTYAEHVARNTCSEFLRSQRHRAALDVEDVASPDGWSRPDEQLLRCEKYREQVRTFAALPRECRELFALLFVEGLNYRKIAERTKLSESAIRSRVHRCRQTGRERATATARAGVRRG